MLKDEKNGMDLSCLLIVFISSVTKVSPVRDYQALNKIEIFFWISHCNYFLFLFWNYGTMGRFSRILEIFKNVLFKKGFKGPPQLA